MHGTTMTARILTAEETGEEYLARYEPNRTIPGGTLTLSRLTAKHGERGPVYLRHADDAQDALTLALDFIAACDAQALRPTPDRYLLRWLGFDELPAHHARWIAPSGECYWLAAHPESDGSYTARSLCFTTSAGGYGALVHATPDGALAEARAICHDYDARTFPPSPLAGLDNPADIDGLLDRQPAAPAEDAPEDDSDLDELPPVLDAYHQLIEENRRLTGEIDRQRGELVELRVALERHARRRDSYRQALVERDQLARERDYWKEQYAAEVARRERYEREVATGITDLAAAMHDLPPYLLLAS